MCLGPCSRGLIRGRLLSMSRRWVHKQYNYCLYFKWRYFLCRFEEISSVERARKLFLPLSQSGKFNTKNKKRPTRICTSYRCTQSLSLNLIFIELVYTSLCPHLAQVGFRCSRHSQTRTDKGSRETHSHTLPSQGCVWGIQWEVWADTQQERHSQGCRQERSWYVWIHACIYPL